MKRTTQKILDTPNLENVLTVLTTQEERATSPSPTSQFSLETKGKQISTTPQTTPKLAQTVGNFSESLMASPTNLEIDQQETEFRAQPSESFVQACESSD